MDFTNSSQILSLHVGQCGIGLGNALWELLPAEHGISCVGECSTANSDDSKGNTNCTFQECQSGKFVPRSIMVDLEPTVIDEVRTGCYRSLHHPDSLISFSEDSANNFARGLFTVGQLATGTIIDRVRKLFEECDKLQAIMIYRALSGGTGTGLTTALLEYLTDYAKIPFFEIPLLPSPTLSSTILEPYNAILAEHFCLEDIDMTFLLDNEALYDMIAKYLKCYNPTFSNVNRIIAQPLSSLTASLRFPSSLYNDIISLQTNLVPFPRIHFPMINMAPVMNRDKGEHQRLEVNLITSDAFDNENQLVKCGKLDCKFMCCALLYRGNISPRKVYDALINIKNKKKLRFVDWCPTGFKVGIVQEGPTVINESLLCPTMFNLTMLSNNTSVAVAIQRMTHKFHIMYSKRAFVHWYVGEGLEENEFSEAIYNMGSLINDYEEVGRDTHELGKNSDDKNTSITNNEVSKFMSDDIDEQDVDIQIMLTNQKSPPQSHSVDIEDKVTISEKEKESALQSDEALPLDKSENMDELEND